MASIDTEIFRSLVDCSPQAMALVDAQSPDYPIVYVNCGFESLTGYSAAELLGHNLRLLQGQDREQDGRQRLRDALSRGERCHVIMRNYRKDGTSFWNEMTVMPLRDPHGKIVYYAGFHQDCGQKFQIDSLLARDPSASSLPPPAVIVRDDRLTGLFSWPYLEGLLKRDWAVAQRERHSIAVFSIDVDALELYNLTFGRAAGDSAIRRVAHCISGCLRRASDATARIDGGSFVAFAPGLSLEQALRLGQTMAERVRELRIHHPRCTVLRYISISVGVASTIPDGTQTYDSLLQNARLQLQTAKQSGRNRAA
jgi:two-component system cell cycle response regulator